MAEVLGIASGAAGLVSLGITVCQGLLAYYSAWKDSDSTVETMYNSVENVTKTLVFLKITIESQRFSPGAIAQAKESVASCEGGIKSLGKKLEKVRTTPLNDGWREKTKAHSRKALYPFKEPTLLKLRDTANDLRDQLGLALSAFQIDASEVSLQKLDALQAQFVIVSQTIDGIRGQVARMSSGSGGLREEVEKISSGVDVLAAAQQAKYLSTIYDWLSPLSGRFENKQQDTFGVSGRQDGSGRLLLQTSEFNLWVEGDGRKALWCPGIPGAGKTVLASFIIDHLQKTFKGLDVGIAYAYCSYKEAEDQTPVNLLADLLRQLLLQKPVLSDQIKSLYEGHIPKKTRPTIAECSALVKDAVAAFSKVFIVIDALDECPEKNNHRGTLLAQIRRLQPGTSFFVTSRNIFNISDEFRDDYHLEIRASNQDITRYLQERLSAASKLSVYTDKDPKLRDTITSTIVTKAQGMFLLVRLHFDSLATKTNVRQIKSALKSLPAELYETYDDVISRINGQDADHAALARKVLSWIFHAARPLTIKEVQHALAVEPGDTDLEEDGITDPINMLSVCRGIATIQKESQIISLVHYTTQSYFEKKGAEFFTYGHPEISHVCLRYLLFDVFKKGPCTKDCEVEGRLENYCLFLYASQNWGNHARAASAEDEILNELAMELLEDGENIGSFIQAMHLSQTRFKGWTQRFPKSVTGLHVAGLFGLEAIAAGFLQLGASMEACDSRGWTALHHAAWSGQASVLKLLLQQKRAPYVDVADNGGRTPLSLAAEHGHVDTAALLIGEGADVGSADNVKQTPLHHGARGGQDAIVELLLTKGSPVNAADVDRWTALHFAAQYGYDQVVRLLLKSGAGVKLFGGRGWTAMHLAAQNGHATALQLILDSGDDVNTLNTSGWSAMDEAASGGFLDVMRILLAKGINVNSRDQEGNRSLHWAAPQGRAPAVRMLLEHGANPNTSNVYGSTPLHFAASEGLEDICSLLLKFQASATAENGYGWTPLHSAAFIGNVKIINLLLDHDADIEAQDEDGWTALHASVQASQYTGLLALLDHDADPTIRDGDGLSPKDLAAVAVDFHPSMQMRKRNAHVKMDVNNGITGLRGAVNGFGYLGVQALLESGVDVNGKDPGGCTALHIAVSQNKVKIAKLLLEYGADVNARDSRGRTPLAESYSKAMTLLLKEWGAKRRKGEHRAVGDDSEDEDTDYSDEDPNETLKLKVLRTAVFKLLCDREEDAETKSFAIDRKEGIFRIRRIDSDVDVEFDRKGMNDSVVVITESILEVDG
ncbi:MAG: hypothetical protein M1839_004783 [Geoglossum umbratile]|nr:MAG: hypothetical protein M1839_004783 [Geoglossum umbratile]